MVDGLIIECANFSGNKHVCVVRLQFVLDFPDIFSTKTLPSHCATSGMHSSAGSLPR